MPDFVNDAFDQAFAARCSAEQEAFSEAMERRGEQLMMTAIAMTGLNEMAKIFDTVRKMGLETVMHKYEMHLMALAFHEGTTAKID